MTDAACFTALRDCENRIGTVPIFFLPGGMTAKEYMEHFAEDNGFRARISSVAHIFRRSAQITCLAGSSLSGVFRISMRIITNATPIPSVVVKQKSDKKEDRKYTLPSRNVDQKD